MAAYQNYASATLFILAIFILFESRKKFNRDNRKNIPYPPGPKGLPLVGNALDMTHNRMWKSMKRWEVEYGELVFVQNLGSPILVLNSYEAIVGLFEKRGHIYSSRPKSAIFDLSGWSDWVVTLFPYGDKLRKARRLLYQHLQLSAVPEYYPIQEASAQKALQGFVASPQDFVEHIRNFAGRSIMKITYGYDALEKDDPYIAIVEKGVRFFSDTQGFFLVNLFPWIQYLPSCLPGTSFHSTSRIGRFLGDEMRNKSYVWAKQEILNGNASKSMASMLLDSSTSRNGVLEDEEIIKDVLGTAYAAGAESVAILLTTFILAMVLHKDVLKRGQEELDRVLGKNCLPTMADQPKLPYIDAIRKECLRWQPVAPFAVPHSVTEDDEYRGYFIPKGTNVLSNLTAISRDPNYYYKPDDFIPERWLPEPGDKPPLDFDKVGFGIGRRFCPGMHMAKNNAFIFIASILAAFDIENAIGDDGAPIIPKVDYVEGLVSYSKPFRCIIKPRSEEVTTLIRQTTEKY